MTKQFAFALATGLLPAVSTVAATSVTAFVAAQPAMAQQVSNAQSVRWIQVEAQPTLREAEARARAYAGRLEGVNGFRLGSNWYAIVLGPYTESAAELQLRNLKSAGLIPADSFIAFSNQLRQQYWPVGASSLNVAPVEAPAQTQEAPQPEPVAVAPTTSTEAVVGLPDETKREAQVSERALDRDARKALQVALQWEGYYTSTIDGAFGPGTRRSMAAWQTDYGYEPTGILTTRQRAVLMDNYQSVLAVLGMAPYEDQTAGISMAIPAGMVEFDRYEAPFVHFKTKDGSDVQLVMISQTGDQNTLFGLYDILQTLEIVPTGGPRERGKNGFTIEGENDKISSFTQVKLLDGTVKGFTLVWPKGDDKRRALALGDMRASFSSLGEQALADDAGLDASTQSLDLLSGLEIRTPDLSRSGFYVDNKGHILTTTEAVQSCARVSVNDAFDANVIASDEALGLALLEPASAQAPIAFASFVNAEPRLKSDVAVAGFSYEGRLSAPSLTFGTLSELTGLNGESELTRLTLAALPGDAGGPVLSTSGSVMGMLLPARGTNSRTLPADTSFATDANTVAAFLSAHGITASTTDSVASVDPVELNMKAADMTVLVSCWN
ncbi:Putative peptidoglycan binding domain-containing protein [Aliiroseovarius halocynthiae]|uniref:Peptidoglycan-binding protein n=1 Tax=Aliiroseovarius halocynthiae TaxID=985055 RepID=A0A545SRJ1_9RHOB|nr:trypsin-like peptidase domain-containing protein [Aliiroseovarius halocynthiae]TQV67516.1 peptidoglycan-binding protein [Aliiroseovarius halocynthiae]SMR81527.1 Putative peptidoglycan binding domain-containing protein [Aliiroseovarius halocynthiae]